MSVGAEPDFGGWEGHDRQQREAWMQTTPAQRLAWLEAAIVFAHKVGALPARDADGGLDTQPPVADNGPPE